MIIREAQLNDLKTIVQLKIRMFQDAGLENLLSDDCDESIYNRYMELYSKRLAVHYLIEIDHIIVAVAGGFLKDDIPYCFYKIKKYGFIGDMYTRSEYRRRGYSTILFNRVLQWLKAQGVKQIQLLASEDGRHMYEKAGFSVNNSNMILTIE